MTWIVVEAGGGGDPYRLEFESKEDAEQHAAYMTANGIGYVWLVLEELKDGSLAGE